MSNITVISTFADIHFDLYAKQMLQSFVQYWPQEVSLFLQLDDDALIDIVAPMLREQDCISVGRTQAHIDFMERNKGKDSPDNYRHQPVRFCHKVFALYNAMQAVKGKSRYLVWLDADVHTTGFVSLESIKWCLPKQGDAVAYLGRKDWPHSECGWLAFDLEDENSAEIITRMYTAYVTDLVLEMEQQHDSWVFDKESAYMKRTNLTPNAKGLDAWSQSPMAQWSTHFKGPAAKAQLAGQPKLQSVAKGNGGLVIQTKNAIPHVEICEHVRKNQALIDNWVRPCSPHDEEVVFVSAGPMLVAEDVRREKGKKIVAVKHALGPLQRAGIKPWASILLDPRPHVADFVNDADPDVIWFVASQVNPEVTLKLLQRGCKIWGYHASVGAGEDVLTKKQEYAIINGGSATATRGLYVMEQLGFKNMTLYGYDLCCPDKPDLAAKDELGQPKYFEMSIGINDPLYAVKRLFWSEPQLIAQFEELNDIIKATRFNLTAYGEGIVPFMIKAKNTADLRRRELKAKITGGKPPYYMDLLNGTAPDDAARPANANGDAAA